MGIKELQKYKSQCLPLTEFDVQNLSRMKEENDYRQFRETISYMLENNIKLEQEAIDFSVTKPAKDALSQFCNGVHDLTIEMHSTWFAISVHINCAAQVSLTFSVSDKKQFLRKFKDEKLDVSPQQTLNIIHKELKKVLSEDFDSYVTAEEYYEPVLEDYYGNCEETVELFCKESGLKIENIDIDTACTDYIENTSRYY